MRRAAHKRAAVVAAMATILGLGCSSTPPESPEQMRADEATTARVYAALEADRLHFYIGLYVRVRGGVAYLGGLTFDPSVSDAATQIASRVPGVTKVVNQIEVSAGAGGY
jgi:osmotically-inducible protein OsmY